jgi:hypothetical protein
MSDELETRLRDFDETMRRRFQSVGPGVCTEAADRIEKLEATVDRQAILLDPDMTFRDIEMKIRDGKLDLRGVLGEESQPIARFLAATMLHFVLGEGAQAPVEPPNYMSGEFSHVLRQEAEAERDAERALADQLAETLRQWGNEPEAQVALKAHEVARS